MHHKYYKIIQSCFLFSLIKMLGSCSEKESAVNGSDHNLSKSIETSFKILILGDSLTEGYGVNEEQSYPFLLEKKLNTEITARTGKIIR